MNTLSCAGLAVGYPATPVLAGVDLAVAPGATLALLGTSGSGKSTLLAAVAGLLRPLAGEIRLSGELVSAPGRHVPPERRRVGMVFQDYALWPHLCALDIVAYPLRRRGLSRADARRRAGELLAGLGLSTLAGRRPGQLSGGEQQRVGLARALAAEPVVFLFDEPTAHLDAHVRTQVLAEVATQRGRTGAAAVYATHDPAEALGIADLVAVLDAGRVAQVGTPEQVYRCPAGPAVARLTGPVSLLRVDPREPRARGRDGAALAAGGGPLLSVGGVPSGIAARLGHGHRVPAAGPLHVLVRPDWAGLGGELPGRVVAVRFAGPHTDYRLDTPGGELLLREPGPPRRRVGADDGWSLRDAWLLPDG